MIDRQELTVVGEAKFIGLDYRYLRGNCTAYQVSLLTNQGLFKWNKLQNVDALIGKNIKQNA